MNDTTSVGYGIFESEIDIKSLFKLNLEHSLLAAVLFATQTAHTRLKRIKRETIIFTDSKTIFKLLKEDSTTHIKVVNTIRTRMFHVNKKNIVNVKKGRTASQSKPSTNRCFRYG